jgi:hypothetical protein
MDRKYIFQQIEMATRVVQKWPLWKQNILKNSGKPRFDVPRKPINNFVPRKPINNGEVIGKKRSHLNN